jgi:hypothetical protein
VFREAFFVVAEVHEIGDTVIVAVRSAGVGDAVILGETWLLGAQVLLVSHSIAIPVRAAAQPWESRLLPTGVVHVANAVPIRIRAPRMLWQAAPFHTFVIGIQHAVAIEVLWRHTTITTSTWLSGAGIFGVDHPIPI